jgi:hypothetical protein
LLGSVISKPQVFERQRDIREEPTRWTAIICMA